MHEHVPQNRQPDPTSAWVPGSHDLLGMVATLAIQTSLNNTALLYKAAVFQPSLGLRKQYFTQRAPQMKTRQGGRRGYVEREEP